ncbi:MAG TPA: lysozyme inhibitor LprI family protein [Candidatus Acidoferrum sp.]|nr:lysozyme inhibitor LprI family protein [Candidatus Acidoferrum sp.]
MKYICILIALTAITTQKSFAVDDYKKSSECNANQTSINRCARDEFEYYDKIVNDLLQKQIDYLKIHDEYKIRVNFNPADDRLKFLKNSQEVWVRYRDADCLYMAGPKESSGSIWGLNYYGCMSERTKTRAIDLENYVNCRENGCPL